MPAPGWRDSVLLAAAPERSTPEVGHVSVVSLGQRPRGICPDTTESVRKGLRGCCRVAMSRRRRRSANVRSCRLTLPFLHNCSEHCDQIVIDHEGYADAA